MITPFGSGVLFGKQKALSGVPTAAPTPRRFAIMQDTQTDFKATNKQLRGQNQMAVRDTRASLECSVKTKLASFDPNLINDLYLGCPTQIGIVQIADSEPQVIGGANITARANATNYAVGALYSSGDYVYKCVTAGVSAAALPALENILGSENADGTAVFQCLCASVNARDVGNAANFVEGWGVILSDGTIMQCSGNVAPLAGEYQVTNGLYVFNNADLGKNGLFSYSFNVPNRGTTILLTNQMQGSSPQFEAFMYDIDENSKYLGIYLSKCKSTDMSLPSKQGDYWTCSFDFNALADEYTGRWGAIYADNY